MRPSRILPNAPARTAVSKPLDRRSHHRHRQQAPSRQLVLAAVTTDGFTGFAYFMRPEVATLFSAAIAMCSVGINLWGGMAMESRRAELKRQMEHETNFQRQQRELVSILSRYRGPLLESIVDLEQRVYHVVSQVYEWSADGLVCEEEVVHTLFTMSQFLGYLEVVRREGPRETSFLQKGNPQGSDTLAAWVEGFRFVMAAHPALLQEWYDQCEPGKRRPHPGQRPRHTMAARVLHPDASSSAQPPAGGPAAAGAAGGSAYAAPNYHTLSMLAMGAGGTGGGGDTGQYADRGRLAVASWDDYDSGGCDGFGVGEGEDPDALGSSSSIEARRPRLRRFGWSASLATVDRNGRPGATGDRVDLLGGADAWSSAPIEGVIFPNAAATAVTPRPGGNGNGTGRSTHAGKVVTNGITEGDEEGLTSRRRQVWPDRSGQDAHKGADLPPPKIDPQAQERFARLWSNFRLSRGTQRAVGSAMIVTPTGADRHYTMSYSEFYKRFRTDAYFAGWLRPMYEDVMQLVACNLGWRGGTPFPVHMHTRLLLMQQMLIDAMDFLDPSYIRVPLCRRVRLCPVEYDDLPNVGAYKQKLEEMDSTTYGILRSEMGGAPPAAGAQEAPRPSGLQALAWVMSGKQESGSDSNDGSGGGDASTRGAPVSSNLRGRG